MVAVVGSGRCGCWFVLWRGGGCCVEWWIVGLILIILESNHFLFYTKVATTRLVFNC